MPDTAYLNPLHNGPCPDPFVLKFCGEYWCYCTGRWHDGRCFGMYRSTDLVTWQEVGGALVPLEKEWPHYWAPEVTYSNGRFYMYYSVGDEVHMEIRVAVAEQPSGPFIDSGVRLTSEPFAIDAHVFEDDDGSRYLFYATDFLEHTHIGTGTVADRMVDLFTLAGRPRPVTRARYDWQIYDPQRREKGGVRWHTVEGPFVLKRNGRYYQMFSGGNWQNTSYGVGYAVSDHIEAETEWEQPCDGLTRPPILRTLPGQVIGPGHNSVVRGPDNQQLFCVYHRWSETLGERLLAIDRLEWVSERMAVLGPSTTPQPRPNAPTIAGWQHGWLLSSGSWMRTDQVLELHSATGSAAARLPLPAPHGIAEVSLRALPAKNGPQRGPERHFGLGCDDEARPLLRLLFYPARRTILIAAQEHSAWREEHIALPTDFDPHCFHLIRLELDGARVQLRLGDTTFVWHRQLASVPSAITLLTHQQLCQATGFAYTIGWQDLFYGASGAPEQLGWCSDDPAWQLREQRLCYTDPHGRRGIISKGPLLAEYEIVVNVRSLAAEEHGCYGILPAFTSSGPGPLIRLIPDGQRCRMVCETTDTPWEIELPAAFDPWSDQQLRLRKHEGRISIQWEAEELGVCAAPAQPTQIGLYADQMEVAFEMVRLTALG